MRLWELLVLELVMLYTRTFEKILRKSPEILDDNVYILIDEAHFDKFWQTTVKVLYDRSKKVFIVVTGSSSVAMEVSSILRVELKKSSFFHSISQSTFC